MTRSGREQQLGISIDGERVHCSRCPANADIRVRSKAVRTIAVTFLRTTPDLVEQVREPFLNPDAPSGTGGQAGQVTAVRRLMRVPSTPAAPAIPRAVVASDVHADDDGAGGTLREDDPVNAGAPRLPGLVTPGRIDPHALRSGRRDGGSFEAGIECALRRLLSALSSTHRNRSSFVRARGGRRRLSHQRPELASRLSFFRAAFRTPVACRGGEWGSAAGRPR